MLDARVIVGRRGELAHEGIVLCARSVDPNAISVVPHLDAVKVLVLWVGLVGVTVEPAGPSLHGVVGAISPAEATVIVPLQVDPDVPLVQLGCAGEVSAEKVVFSLAGDGGQLAASVSTPRCSLAPLRDLAVKLPALLHTIALEHNAALEIARPVDERLGRAIVGNKSASVPDSRVRDAAGADLLGAA
eukprot:3936027-Rhodomonas_salina.1